VISNLLLLLLYLTRYTVRQRGSPAGTFCSFLGNRLEF